jgi:hypothetical protein
MLVYLHHRRGSVKATGSTDRGNEQISFLTMPCSIRAASPTWPLPALLLTMVRLVGLPLARKRSIRAWISSIGAPEPPKPPIITVDPLVMLATAASSEGRVLSTVGASSEFIAVSPGVRSYRIAPDLRSRLPARKTI